MNNNFKFKSTGLTEQLIKRKIITFDGHSICCGSLCREVTTDIWPYASLDTRIALVTWTSGVNLSGFH